RLPHAGRKRGIPDHRRGNGLRPVLLAPQSRLCAADAGAASASGQMPRRSDVGRVGDPQSPPSIFDPPPPFGSRRGLPRKHWIRPRLPRPSADELVIDVDDCVAGARFLAAQGRVDPMRCVISGGSAGGYTTLAALTFRDFFQGGASYYGVSDIAALARDTHKFESRYLDWLIGPYPQEE